MTPGLNHAKAVAAWGDPLPRWIEMLAGSCDATSQNQVATRLEVSSGYVSRLINNRYTGDMAEAERQVLAKLTSDRVLCPFWRHRIPLSSCIRQRRRTATSDETMRRWRSACDACPINTDRETAR